MALNARNSFSLEYSRSPEVMKRTARPESVRKSRRHGMTKRIVGVQRSDSRLWARGLC